MELIEQYVNSISSIGTNEIIAYAMLGISKITDNQAILSSSYYKLLYSCAASGNIKIEYELASLLLTHGLYSEIFQYICSSLGASSSSISMPTLSEFREAFISDSSNYNSYFLLGQCILENALMNEKLDIDHCIKYSLLFYEKAFELGKKDAYLCYLFFIYQHEIDDDFYTSFADVIERGIEKGDVGCWIIKGLCHGDREEANQYFMNAIRGGVLKGIPFLLTNADIKEQDYFVDALINYRNEPISDKSSVFKMLKEDKSEFCQFVYKLLYLEDGWLELGQSLISKSDWVPILIANGLMRSQASNEEIEKYLIMPATEILPTEPRFLSVILTSAVLDDRAEMGILIGLLIKTHDFKNVHQLIVCYHQFFPKDMQEQFIKRLITISYADRIGSFMVFNMYWEQSDFALKLIRGDSGTPRIPRYGYWILEELADSFHNPRAMSILGALLLNEVRVTPTQRERGIQYFMRGSYLNNNTSIGLLGDFYNSEQHDLGAATLLYRIAYFLDSPKVTCSMAAIYNEFVTGDAWRQFIWEGSLRNEYACISALLMEAIENDPKYSCKVLNFMLSKGMDVGFWVTGWLQEYKFIGNPAGAIKVYKEGAEKNNPASMYYLGLCYEFGKCGEKKDLQKAVQLYKKASDGYMNADLRLGYFYEKGIIVGKDINEAVSRYMRLARKGSLEAVYYMAYMNQYGIVKGSPQDALKFYEHRRALFKQFPDAIPHYAKLLFQLGVFELEKVTELLLDCVPGNFVIYALHKLWDGFAFIHEPRK